MNIKILFFETVILLVFGYLIRYFLNTETFSQKLVAGLFGIGMYLLGAYNEHLVNENVIRQSIQETKR